VARFWQRGKIHVGIHSCFLALTLGNQARFWQPGKISVIRQDFGNLATEFLNIIYSILSNISLSKTQHTTTALQRQSQDGIHA
jgi:hypothetical protein